jgi:hypothetical protein
MRLLLPAMAMFLAVGSRSFAQGDGTDSLCGIHYPSDDSMEWECRELEWNETPRDLAGDRWRDLLRFNRLDRRHFFGGLKIKVPKDPETIRDFSPLPDYYPDAVEEAQFILVDLDEMFLGAYEHGEKVLSFPVAVGMNGYRVPTGEFRIDAVDRRHESNMYLIEELDRPYPMHYGLRFYVDRRGDGASYWIHGRDLPGYPASHGCLGLYDEEMQKEYYGSHDHDAHKKYFRELTEPYLEGAKELYGWVLGNRKDSGTLQSVKHGPKVLIIGTETTEQP